MVTAAMKLKAPWKKTFLKEINYERKTPWKKSYDKPRQYINSRDITLPTKVCIVKAMIFPAIIYGYESWAIKKAEWQRIDAFELWLWRKFSRVPWTARSSNQSILKKKKKKINPEYSLEGLMLKLKLWYSGLLMRTADLLEKTLSLGKTEDRRRRGPQRMRWLDDITNAINTNFSRLREIVKDREACCAAVHGVAKSWTGLSDGTTWYLCNNLMLSLKIIIINVILFFKITIQSNWLYYRIALGIFTQVYYSCKHHHN